MQLGEVDSEVGDVDHVLDSVAVRVADPYMRWEDPEDNLETVEKLD